MEQFSGQRASLLFVGDPEKDSGIIDEVLEKLGMPFITQWIEPAGGLSASTHLDAWDLAVILSTKRHPATALPLVTALLPIAQGRPVLLVLPDGQDQLGVHAIELGARDYITADTQARFEAVLKRELRDQLTSPRSLERGQYHRILNSASDAIITVDPKSEITFFNHAAETVFGYTASEILGEHLELLLPERFSGNHQNNLDGFATSDTTSVIFNEKKIFYGKRKNGEEFPAEINISRSGEGMHARFTAIVRDVTQRIHLEEQLRDYAHSLELRVEQRTAELNAARLDAVSMAKSKADYLSLMSHEIRTPLNAIVGLSLLLNREELPQKASDLAGRIHQSGKHVVSLVNDILDLSKLEAGKVRMLSEPFFLGDTLSHLADLMRSLATGKGLELAIHPPPRSCQYLCGDAGKLVQILTNLVSNAIKFTDEGEVLLAVSVVSQSESSVELKFSVSDTGVGISEASQQHLFDPYEQADSSTSRRFGGTGLGLAICKNLVELQGGNIRVSSELGKGSEFAVTLPYQLDLNAAELAKPEQQLKILFADDCEISREAIRLNVEELGYQTSSFSDGSQILNHFIRKPELHSPETILILDYYMPNMTGAQVAKSIRDQLRPEHHPTIVIASSDEPDTFSNGPAQNHADAIVHKTLTASGLDALIQRLLRARNAEAAEPSKPQHIEQALAGIKMLVVDDNETNLDVARGLFSSEGASVSCMSDGLQAVQQLLSGQTSFDLVLMDISMPVMDGLQATEIIREHFSAEQLPIIALSAGTLEVQQIQALESGMNAFIPKPFELDDAIEVILKTLKGAKYTPPQEDALPETEAKNEALESELFNPIQAMSLYQNEAVYQRHLRNLMSETETALLRIQADTLSIKELAAVAHRIAGSAGNLGLPALHESAKLLERCAIFNEPTAPAILALTNLFEATQAEVQAYLKPLTDESTPARCVGTVQMDIAEISALLNEAIRGVQAFSPAQVEAPIQLLALKLQRCELDAILEHISQFDFSGAEQLLTQLLTEYEQ